MSSVLEPGRERAGGPGEHDSPRYDKELVKAGLFDICAYYLGAGKPQGIRMLWRCPECGGEDKFAANGRRLITGCLSAGCALNDMMDSIRVISHFEQIRAAGEGFPLILKRGYEILGIPDPTQRPHRPAAPSGSRPSFTGPSDGLWTGRPYVPDFGPPATRTAAPNAARNAARQDHETDVNTSDQKGFPDYQSNDRTRDRDHFPHQDEEMIVEIVEGEAVDETASDFEDRPPDSPEQDAVITVEADEDDGLTAAAGRQDSSPGYRARYEPVGASRVLATGRGVDAEVYALYEEPDFTLDEDLLDAVYEEILKMSELTDPNRQWLKDRGVSGVTAHGARLASMTKKRAREVKRALSIKFSDDDLLRVPGFSKGRLRGLSFTLSGDYLFIPYFDPDGRVATIEGRATGQIPKGMGKYVSLRGGGNHLYLFPQFLPERIEAFCEGPLGAIVAAQSGIAVGSIQGMRRYKDARAGGPLPELKGVDFGGRRIPYIPDVDVKPQAIADVRAALPEACRHLVAQQNGRPTVATLPEGKDLDEWLLTLPSAGRRAAFTSFVSEAVSLEEYQGSIHNEVIHDGAISGLHPPDGRDVARQPYAHDTPDPPPSTTINPPGRADQADNIAEPTRGPARPGPLADDTEPVPHEETQAPEDQSASIEVSHENSRDDEERAELTARVFAALIRMSSLVERDITLLSRLGVPEEVVREAGIHSMSPRRAEGVLSRLAANFGADQLASVDGFREGNGGRILMDFAGDYCLIPVRDPSGSIASIQAIPVAADESGPVPDTSRKPLVRGLPGDHLYVPGGDTSALEAITVGPVEVLRLCAAGIKAGAIHKIGAYKPAPGKEVMGGLDGVDFRGRKILYSPTLGDPPSQRVLSDAPNALRTLIARHGGIPIMLEEDPDGRRLGEWLLDQSLWGRRAAFDELVAGAFVAEGMLEKERKKQSRTRRKAEANQGAVNQGAVNQGAADTNYPAQSGGEQSEDVRQTPAKSELRAGPVIVPAPDNPPLLPPAVRAKPLTGPELATMTKAWLACVFIVLFALTFWHLPAQMIHYSQIYLGGPVAGREIHVAALARLWLTATAHATATAIWTALPTALLRGSEAGLLLSAAIVPLLMRRRTLYRLIVTGKVPKKKWWTLWRSD